MAWTPTSLVRRSPGARDPRVETEAGTRRLVGPRRAAREALEAEEAALTEFQAPWSDSEYSDDDEEGAEEEGAEQTRC